MKERRSNSGEGRDGGREGFDRKRKLESHRTGKGMQSPIQEHEEEKTGAGELFVNV